MSTRCPRLLLIVTLTAPALLLAQSAPAPQTTLPSTAAVGVDGFTSGFFPVMPWDFLHGYAEPHIERVNGLAGIAECGFNMAGFVQARDLAECERLGLKALLASPPGAGAWRNLTDEQIERRVRQQVDAGAKSPAVAGYYLTDEPGTREFPALAKAVAAVRRHAPGKLAYINLYPGYATVGAPDSSQLGAASYTDYLEQFVAQVQPQFISYDNYMVQYSDDLQKSDIAARYFADLLEVRRVALRHNLPFWNVVSSNQIRPETAIPTPANMALQAFTTLAAGGRGVAWYTYHGSSRPVRGYGYAPIDHHGLKTDTWLYLQMINRQLRRLGPTMNMLTSTGVFFSSHPPVEKGPLLPGRLVESIQSRASRRDTRAFEPVIMVGEFKDQDGRDCVMPVNLNLQYSANLEVTWLGGKREVEIASAADGQWRPLDDSKGFWLAAGTGCLLRTR